MFNVYDYVVCYRNAAGEDRLFLPFHASMAFFRQMYPKGSVKSEILMNDGRSCLCEGHVVVDGIELANGYAMAKFSETEEGKNYVSMAATSAMRKALENAGFGCPVDAVVIPDKTRIISDTEVEPDGDGILLPQPKGTKAPDAPSVSTEQKANETQKQPAQESSNSTESTEANVEPAKTESTPPAPETAAPEKKKRGRKKKEAQSQAPNTTDAKDDVASDGEPDSNLESDPEAPDSPNEENVVLAFKKRLESLPEEEAKEEAWNTMLQTGRCKGMTLREAYQDGGPRVLEMYSKNWYQSSKVWAAANFLLEKQ